MNQMIANQLLGSQKIAFIQAAWHDDIVGQGRESFIAEMEKYGISSDRIEIFDVPGSLEIPLQSKWIAETGDYAIIVACGFVVNGGIYRHDFVASTVIDGMMRVQLDTNVPILSVVLTPHNFHEHEEHHQYFFEHFKKKGKEAANACVKTLENRAQFMQEKAAA
ncbi:MAG: 6,7-dimethyl-8-ribityllumazine synthase [Alphaproteobacteria bacterium]|nr:6,7-dimethyl-8-ribityllumazine synthase [Alphaproteobacteria bacterium]